jgi:hypothetical protein
VPHSTCERQADGDRVAERSLLELQLDLVAQVRAPEHPRAAAPPGAEDVAEDLAEDVAEGVPRPETAAAGPRAAADPRMPELVIGGALARVLENLPGLLDFLEGRLGLRIARVAIGVELHGESPIGLLELGLSRVPGQAEGLVVVALRHAALRG